MLHIFELIYTKPEAFFMKLCEFYIKPLRMYQNYLGITYHDIWGELCTMMQCEQRIYGAESTLLKVHGSAKVCNLPHRSFQVLILGIFL